MRVIFMGTPEIAVPILEGIAEAGHEIAAVITRQDAPKGRGKTLLPPPVKVKALELGLNVLQPAKIWDEAFLDQIRELAPEAAVVAAYGKILPEELLGIPRYGCLNVHASLLPAYRGAAPIERAILNGEKETGVTIMQMDAGLDTGDMIGQITVPIDPKETAESLTEKLAKAGREGIVRVLADLPSGMILRVPQEGESSYAQKIEKEDGRMDFAQPAAVLERKIRALSPKPGAYAYLQGKQMKFGAADVVECAAGSPGEVVSVGKNDFTIACGEGGLLVRRLQAEGKKMMDTGAFLRGYALKAGETFTSFPQ